jgi:predicted transcriptional regulator
MRNIMTLQIHKGLKFCMTATMKPETVKRLDRFRGQIPRSRVVETALLQYLDRQSQKQKQEEVALGDASDKS